MSWYDEVEQGQRYYAEIKSGLLGKKNVIGLVVNKTDMEVTAFHVDEGIIEKESQTYYFDYSEIKSVYAGEIEGKTGLIIEYRYKYNSSYITARRENEKIILPDIPDTEKWVTMINSAKEKIEVQEREKQEKKRERELKAVEKEQNAVDFYKKCYDFHIKENTPCYELFREENKFAAIYIGEDKSLNFLKIDGYGEEESNGIIPYDKIHYYDNAGDIHYVTDIHGTYSNYGGSITGGNFSKLASAGGGVLFGFMGMTAGALLSYKPTEYKADSTSFKIDSDVKKIDARSVILNFYSDMKKQYIDIELPSDIYNFLQTYLPEKKQNIVLELEKKAIIEQELLGVESEEKRKLEVKKQQGVDANDSIEAFKLKVDKLKMMKDADLLTVEEFNIEKAKLLEML